MTENDNFRKGVKLEIQSLLCTEKAYITSRRLYGLYMTEIGSPIPFVKLGFNNIEDLLKSMPDVVSSYTDATDGMLYVKAVPLEGSSHINELVCGQRTSKPKKKKSNGYSLNSKFRGFRVSSQVAPNRNFNKNCNNFKPHERYDNSKTGNFVRESSFGVSNNCSSLPPRFMQTYRQASLLGLPPSAFHVETPSFSMYKHAGLLHSESHLFNKDCNMNNNLNQNFIKQHNLSEDETVVLSSESSNSAPVNKPQGLAGRAHMTPQLMQPRTSVISELSLVKCKAAVVPLNDSSKSPTVTKCQGLPGRTHMTPQLMQPRTPVYQAQPDTTMSHIISEPPMKILSPKPLAVHLSNIDPVQKFPFNSNVSLNSVEPQFLEQVSYARQPNPSTSRSQLFFSPTGNNTTISNVFQWKQLELKPVQVSIKHESQTVYAPGVVQPAVSHQIRLLTEDEATHVQHSTTLTSQQCKPPGITQLSTSLCTSTSVEEMVGSTVEEPSRSPEPRQIQQMQPTTPTFCPKLPECAHQKPCPPQKITPSDSVTRVLLKNALPVASPSPSSQPLVYRLDNTTESAPATLPFTPGPRLPSSPSHLLSRRLPYRSNELHPVAGTVVNNVTLGRSARSTVPSDRLAEFHCERLKTLVTTYNLGKVTLNHNQLKTGRFIASIKVGQDVFITYPYDFENVTDAYEDAAEQAVNHFETTPVWMQPT